MSSRIRILFRSGLDGRAHAGKKALRIMQSICAMNKGTKWLSETEWLQRGQPVYVESRVTFTNNALNSVGRVYLVEGMAVDTAPVQGTVLERVKLLWGRLPEKIRQGSQLIVTRENRRNAWKHSLANPAKHGWPVKKASSTWTVPHQVSYAVADDTVKSSIQGLIEQADALGLKPVKKAQKGAPVPSLLKKPGGHPATAPSAEEKVKLKLGIWA